MNDTASNYARRADAVPNELAELAEHDPIVRAHIRMYLSSSMPLPEMLVALAVSLARSTAEYRRELVRLHSLLPPPRMVNIQP